MSIRWFMGAAPGIEPYLREQQYTTPGTYEFVVPSGVKTMKALVIGGGARYSNSTGGKGGGVISGTFNVNSDQVLNIVVGAVAATKGGVSSIASFGKTLLLGDGGTNLKRGASLFSSDVNILSNYNAVNLPTTGGKACKSFLQMADDDWQYYPFYASSGAGLGGLNGAVAPAVPGTLIGRYGVGGNGSLVTGPGGGGGAGVIGGRGGSPYYNNNYNCGGEGGTGLGGGGGGGILNRNESFRGGDGGWWSNDGTLSAGGNYRASVGTPRGGSGGHGFMNPSGVALGGYAGSIGSLGGGGGGEGGGFGGYGGDGGKGSSDSEGFGGAGGNGGYGGNGGDGGSGGGNVGAGGNGGPGAVVIWY